MTLSAARRFAVVCWALLVVASGAASTSPSNAATDEPRCEKSVGPLDNWDAVKSAAKTACAGQTITLAPGRYRIGRREVILAMAHGSPEAPITFRAERLGDVILEVEFREASRIRGSYWIFENLEFRGVCEKHDACEHAFHLQPGAHHITMRNNRVIDFSAGLKSSAPNDSTSGSGAPSFGVVERNWFYNTAPRDTDRPVNSLNINGGRGWIVRDNFIADFRKLRGNRVAYAAYMKWDSFDGVFERNLVLCEWRLHGGVRIGISFGGGGSRSPVEHTNGIIRNNIIMNCPNDLGIYVNRAAATKVYNNTLYNTLGIDVRFPVSDAEVYNNIISGGISERDSGTAVAEHNIVTGTPAAIWLPGLGRYLKRRLDGQDEKYPSLFEKSDVLYLQALVDSTIEWTMDSWLGRGNGTLEDVFVDPARGNLALRDPEAVVDKGLDLPEVTDDFCGRPRRSSPHDLGAIEYGPDGAPNCDILDMVRRIPEMR
jgi:hypothetical protein